MSLTYETGGYYGHLKDKWHHVAVVRSGAYLYSFFDGKLLDKCTIGADYEFTSDKFLINSHYIDLGSYAWKGYYDEVVISQGAKWTEDFTPPDPSEPGNSNDYIITEKYQDKNGNELKTNASKTVAEGSDYNAAAPVIPGYKVIGYKVDGSVMLSGSTVKLASVDANHEIIFIYKKDDGSGGNGDGDGDSCGCCCAPVINIETAPINVYYSCNCNDDCCS